MVWAIIINAIGIIFGIVGGIVRYNLGYFDHDMRRVTRARFKEKQFSVDDETTLNYAEGPENGPALLLIHGQTTDWHNYTRVLPALSKHYHIYLVDCHGHGNSSWNANKYSACAMGADFVKFIEQIIQQPVFVSGHSSGGLLAAWLAANSPENVVAVILEDPPFFSSEASRKQNTFNYVDLAVNCHQFLQQCAETDLTRYLVQHAYWLKFFGNGQQGITNYALSYRKRHPQKPLKFFFMPPAVNEIFRTMDVYDPHFGDAFYDDSWHKGFDHADTCARITCPSILIHTNWKYDGNGILLAAMDDKDANRAHALIKNNLLINVNSGHGFHFEKPREFIRIVQDFKAFQRD